MSMNTTMAPVPLNTARHSMPSGRNYIINSVYILGIINNLAAVAYLYRSESAPRNARHSLLLKSLAFNDLFAVLGMCAQMNTKILFPTVTATRWFCIFRVLWRSFGLGSGCIVCVMAVDRWIALTRPFFYQKYVTIGHIKKAILALWLTDFGLVCLPFFGFGLYYKADKSECFRFKYADTPVDKAYAYLYLVFGMLLCGCLVVCNVAVMRSLTCQRKAQAKNKKVLIRRISKNQDLTASACTAEEVAFARLMLLLCAVFLVCWLPQLITVPVAQISARAKCNWFINLADVILAVHFVINPYFYVLQKWKWLTGFCKRKRGSQGNSIKTSTNEELVTL